MQVKRILYVVHSLNTGGLERMVIDLANALDAERYMPFICCIAAPGDLAALFRLPNNLFVLGNRGRVNVASMDRMRRFIARRSIDVIHTHNMAGLLYAFAGAKLLRVPIIHTNHGFAPPDSDNAALNIVERWMSRRIFRYACVSHTLKKSILSRWKFRADDVLVVYNGVRAADNSSLSSPPARDDVIIGSVGRLHAIKNYPLLIESFAEILRRYPRCRLELVGDGPESAALAALAKKLGLTDKDVRFVGRTRNVMEHLVKFDMFVLPSLSEGLSLSILEALSMGKICVASNVGGNPEIIQHGVNGLLFESNDRRALTETLSYAIENLHSAPMTQLRLNAIGTIRERFSFDAMVKAYCKLYEDAMQ